MFFTLVCPAKETELFEELTVWLRENASTATYQELPERDEETPDNWWTCFGRETLKVCIPDEAEAVAFKLRFGDEIERKNELYPNLAYWKKMVNKVTMNSMYGSLHHNVFMPTVPAISPKTATGRYDILYSSGNNLVFPSSTRMVLPKP